MYTHLYLCTYVYRRRIYYEVIHEIMAFKYGHYINIFISIYNNATHLVELKCYSYAACAVPAQIAMNINI